MKNYNEQKQMYAVILLFNLFNSSSTTDFTVIGSNSVQRATHNAWEIFRNLGYMYDALQHNINWKTFQVKF